MGSPRRSHGRYRILWVFLGTLAIGSCKSADDGAGLDPDSEPVPPGSVNVTVSTTGNGLPATYSLTVTSSDASLQHTGTIPANGTRSFADVPATVTVQAQIGEIPVNCTLSGQNPRTITIQSGQQTTIAFQVACVALVGSVRVLTVTTGTELDLDGYSVTVGGQTAAIDPNDSETFSGLAIGNQAVVLSGVVETCTVSSENPRTLSVAFGLTTETTFQITCPVALLVRTQTTGEDLDPDGYALSVDAGAAGPIATNGSATLALAPGNHTVDLAGASANCTVGGDNPRVVTLQENVGAETLFQITCQAHSGTITAQTTTTGWDLPAGFGLTVDAENQGNIGPNAESDLTGFASGLRSVQLTGIPANCSVQGANPQIVNVTVGQSVQAAFTVACGGIAFESDRTGSVQVFVAPSDGSAPPTQMTGFLPTNQGPAWSPGRTEIAFACHPGVSLEICLQSVDQPWIQPTILTGDGFTDTDPEWSPDGTKIAFKSNRDGDREIYVMNTDGTGLLQLTNNLADDEDPSWSPDGQQIVFHSNRDGDHEIYVMNADGSSGESPTRLTNNVTNEVDAAWSPDGASIAIVSDRFGFREVFLIASDGSSGQNFVRLTTNTDDDESPAWSPDGTMIAFTSDRDGDDEIYIMMADGSSGENPLKLTDNTAKDDEANWRD